jgi:hypothetical protein
MFLSRAKESALYPYDPSSLAPLESRTYPPELSVRYCGAGGAATVRSTGRVVLPKPLVAFVKTMSAWYVPGASEYTISLNVKVTLLGEDVSTPEVCDTFSQLGTLEIE